MTNIVSLLASHGYLTLFVLVLFEQSGVPVPSFPAVILAGAMLADQKLNLGAIALVILLADFIPSFSWFYVGRRQGRRVLALLCRISITPDVCIRQTEAAFTARGTGTIIVAKFIPGLSLVTPALAGMLGVPRWKFFTLNTVGLISYSGPALALGFLFHGSVDQVLQAVSNMGRGATLVIVCGFALYIGYKWVKRTFMKGSAIQRVSVQELETMLRSEHPPVIVDVRNAGVQNLERIPGALHVRMELKGKELETFSHDSPIIIYCACPNEVSAVKISRHLRKRGFTNVRPLLGGIDAWREAGFEVTKEGILDANL